MGIREEQISVDCITVDIQRETVAGHVFDTAFKTGDISISGQRPCAGFVQNYINSTNLRGNLRILGVYNIATEGALKDAAVLQRQIQRGIVACQDRSIKNLAVGDQVAGV